MSSSYGDSDSLSESQKQVPVLEAYDQTQFIQGRNENIKKMRNDAGEIHQIATDINQDIYEQDNKLDQLNRDLLSTHSDVRKANQDLFQASEMSGKQKNKICLCSLGVLALISIIVVLLYIFLTNK